MVNRTTYHKVCIVCNSPFTTHQTRQETCSRRCGQKRRIVIPDPIYQPDTDTYLIPMSHGYFATIDAIDVDLATKYKWYPRRKRTSNTVYATRFDRDDNGSKIEGTLHRAIYERILGTAIADGVKVDHKDRDGLNCRRDNVRVATDSQNQANRRGGKNKAGLKGVRWNESRKRWRAVITVNRRVIFLGSFTTPEEAHEAYMEAAKKHFGEFASDGKPIK